MGFPRQEYWTGLPFPSPEDLPDPGIEPGSPALQADSLPSKPSGKPNVHGISHLCFTRMRFCSFLEATGRQYDGPQKDSVLEIR